MARKNFHCPQCGSGDVDMVEEDPPFIVCTDCGYDESTHSPVFRSNASAR